VERTFQKKIADFSLIGAGRLGTALALGLVAKGLTLKVISDCSLKKARILRRLAGQGRATTDNLKAASSAGILFLCVPDDLIPEVVREISVADFTYKTVFHTSGASSSALLEPLARRGAAIASFHPVQTFATLKTDPAIFKGIYFGLEGQSQAIAIGMQLAKKLGGHCLLLADEDKPVYHLACSVSSNFLVVLLAEVKRLLETLGFEEKAFLEIIEPLLKRTLQNVKNLGLEKSLTGPVVRGDLKTVRSHLTITSKFPAFDRIYRAMALEALKIGEKTGLDKDKVRALRRLLKQK